MNLSRIVDNFSVLDSGHRDARRPNSHRQREPYPPPARRHSPQFTSSQHLILSSDPLTPTESKSSPQIYHDYRYEEPSQPRAVNCRKGQRHSYDDHVGTEKQLKAPIKLEDSDHTDIKPPVAGINTNFETHNGQSSSALIENGIKRSPLLRTENITKDSSTSSQETQLTSVTVALGDAGISKGAKSKEKSEASDIDQSLRKATQNPLVENIAYKIPVLATTEVQRITFDATTNQYVCSNCHRRFARKSDLVRHLRIHLGILPNRCDFCGKRFIQSSALKVHRRVHTGEKPYECPVCSRKFSDSSSLARHRRIHIRKNQVVSTPPASVSASSVLKNPSALPAFIAIPALPATPALLSPLSPLSSSPSFGAITQSQLPPPNLLQPITKAAPPCQMCLSAKIGANSETANFRKLCDSRGRRHGDERDGQ